ncbi:MAG: hypothetical protein WCG07_02780, partial [Candidatus Taylorbacteria bacterium]
LVFVATGVYSMIHPERIFGAVVSVSHDFTESISASSAEFTNMFASMAGTDMSASAGDAVDSLKGNILDDSRVGLMTNILKLMGADISN